MDHLDRLKNIHFVETTVHTKPVDPDQAKDETVAAPGHSFHPIVHMLNGQSVADVLAAHAGPVPTPAPTPAPAASADASDPDARLKEKLLTHEVIYDGAVVHLEKWQVELPNGRKSSREIIRHVGAAAVLAINDKGEACMVRQYRTALDQVTLEIPAGKLEHKNDDPLLAAKRELSEETGLEAADWRHLTRIYTTVGFCDEKIDIYLATGLTQGNVHCDEDEFVDTLYIPFDTLVEQASAGQVTDAKTLCAITLTKVLLQKR